MKGGLDCANRTLLRVIAFSKLERGKGCSRPALLSVLLWLLVHKGHSFCDTKNPAGFFNNQRAHAICPRNTQSEGVGRIIPYMGARTGYTITPGNISAFAGQKKGGLRWLKGLRVWPKTWKLAISGRNPNFSRLFGRNNIQDPRPPYLLIVEH